jgi:hypothetical protein
MAGRKLKHLPRCNAWARTRRRHCRAKVVPGKTRCRFHGGMSTGPRTPGGKARRSAHVKAEWAEWRRERGLPPDWRFDGSRRKGARVTAAQWLAEYGPWRPEADGESS